MLNILEKYLINKSLAMINNAYLDSTVNEKDVILYGLNMINNYKDDDLVNLILQNAEIKRDFINFIINLEGYEIKKGVVYATYN